jgi:class 3 adenylate cyclase
MPRLQRKSVSTPDEVRRFATGHIDLVNLDETAIGHVVFEPGWRWSTDIAPIAGTASCQNRHVGYAIGGRLHVVMDDGTVLEIGPGDAYEIPPGHDAWVVGEDAWDTVEFASSRVYGADPGADDERILATILFTDIVDSTATLARVGDRAWRQLLLEHNQRVRGVIDAYRGREIVTTGDGFLALFDGAARAVRCAVAVGPAVADLGIAIRAGLHTGEVAMTGGQASGLAIHAAARVAALAEANEVLVSGTTRDLLDGSGLAFEDRGSHELKGIEGARQVFAVVRA